MSTRREIPASRNLTLALEVIAAEARARLTAAVQEEATLRGLTAWEWDEQRRAFVIPAEEG